MRIAESSSPNDRPFEGSTLCTTSCGMEKFITLNLMLFYAIDNLKRGDKVISENCSHKDVSFRLKYGENG